MATTAGNNSLGPGLLGMKIKALKGEEAREASKVRCLLNLPRTRFFPQRSIVHTCRQVPVRYFMILRTVSDGQLAS